jgi:quercetin dioxygenase-like cupin family protein
MQKEFLLKTYIEDETVPWTVVEKGIDRKVMAYNDDLMMVKVRFEAGSIGYLHQHVHTQITYIESGIFEVIVQNGKKILGKGDVFFIPSNIKHGVKCIENGILIDVFNPLRSDFI